MAFSEYGKNERRSKNLDFSSSSQNIKPYDFRTPKKFTKEHLRTLNTVSDLFSRNLVSNLSGMLRIICELTKTKIEEIRYGEFIEMLPSKTMIGSVNFRFIDKDRETTALFHVPPSIAYFLIDILLGGSGKGVEINRAHTEIEIAILENLISKFCSLYEDAWQSIGNVSFTLEGSETNPKMLQIMSANDSVIVMSFEIRMAQVTDKVSICIPSLYLEEILGDSAAKAKAKAVQKIDSEKEKQRKQLIYDLLSDTELELKAVLCDFEIGMSDLLSLQVDDVIPLDLKISDDIKVLVDDVPWFNAKLGQSNIKKAVKLCGIIEQGDPHNGN